MDEINKNNLAQRLRDLGTQKNTARQIANRLEELLPKRLKAIQMDYEKKFPKKKGKALRLSLMDQTYRDYLDEIAQAKAFALENQIKWETHWFLWDTQKYKDTRAP
jgi:hypothetical protein